jgi:hypothetical protein
MQVPPWMGVDEILGKGNEHNNSPLCYMSSQGYNECDAKRVTEWKKATMKHFKVFGCPTYAFKSKLTRRSKLEPKSTKCIFVGYSADSKVYKLINIVIGKLILSHNVIFNKIIASSNHVHGKTPPSMGDFSKHTNILKTMNGR